MDEVVNRIPSLTRREVLLLCTAALSCKPDRNPSEETLLASVCITILPSAREVGAVAYVERVLREEPVLARIAPAIYRSLDALAKAARTAGESFAQMKVGDREALVGKLARGELTPAESAHPAVFRALHALVLEGYLGDPRHGEDRDRKMNPSELTMYKTRISSRTS